MREEMPIGFGFALAENESNVKFCKNDRRGEKAGHGSSKKRTDQEWDAESGGRPWKIRRIKNKRTGVDSQR